MAAGTPDTTPDNLLAAADAAVDAGNLDLARSLYERLAAEHSGAPEAIQARRALKNHLGGRAQGTGSRAEIGPGGRRARRAGGLGRGGRSPGALLDEDLRSGCASRPGRSWTSA